MKRHSLNVFSLVLGVTLIFLAAWIAFPTRDWLFGTPQWLLPTAVILIGAALMSPLLTSKEAKARSQEESGDVERPPEVSNITPSGASKSDRPTDEHRRASSGQATEEA